MASKKQGIRAKRQNYIKRDLRELRKLGFEEVEVLGEKSIESIAYNKTGYENYRRHVRKLKAKARTNQHGIKFTVKQFNEIKQLERELENKKKKEFQKVLQNNPNMNSVERAYLMGKDITTKTSSESFRKTVNFSKEDILNTINRIEDYEELIEYFREKIRDFDGERIANERSFPFESFLIDLVREGYISEDEGDLLKDLFYELPSHKRAYVKKCMDKARQQVESAITKRGNYSGDPFGAVHDLIIKKGMNDYIIV